MSVYLRKYGVATTINFPMIDAGTLNFANTGDWTPVAADTQISKDEAAFANTGSTPAAEGQGSWSLALTATEMQAARIMITIIDAATKAVEDQAIIVETYGNASAQHAFDLDTASSAQTGDTFAKLAGITSLADWLAAIAAKHTNATAVTEIRAAGAGGGTFDNVSDSGEGIRDTAPMGVLMRGTDSASTHSAVDAAIATWDRVLTGGTHNIATSAGRRLRELQESGGYQGAIWIDTVGGTAGTTDFTNGTDTNPVNSIADANTLAASLNISRFRIAPGSSITLAATQANQVFDGLNWTLALGGQSIDGSVFRGALVTGIATNTSGTQVFMDCRMGAVTLPSNTHVIGSGIAGTQTVGETGDYFYDQCDSEMAGTGTPVLDINSVATVNISWRHYSGGLQVNNAVATTTMSYESDGQLIVAATCTSLTIVVRGDCSITDSGTTTSLTEDAAINRTMSLSGSVGSVTAQVSADVTAISGDTAAADMLEALMDGGILAQVAGGTPTTTTFLGDQFTEATDDHFNGRLITFVTGALKGQQTDITDYTGSTQLFTVTAMTEAPADDDWFVVH